MLGPGNRSVSPCCPQVALKSRGQSRRRRPRPGPAGAGRLWKASGGHWQHGHSQTPVRERVVLRQPPPSFHTTPRWCLQNWPTGVRAPDPRAACVGGGPWETPATGPGGPTQAPRPTPTLETQAPSGGPTAGTPDTRSERDRAPASWPHVVASDSLGHRHLHEHLQRGVLFPGGQA